LSGAFNQFWNCSAPKPTIVPHSTQVANKIGETPLVIAKPFMQAKMQVRCCASYSCVYRLIC
jgi:hypothetical protein